MAYTITTKKGIKRVLLRLQLPIRMGKGLETLAKQEKETDIYVAKELIREGLERRGLWNVDFNLYFQPPLFLGPLGWLPMQPFVIATLRYSQKRAHPPDTMPESHCFHHRVPGSDSFAKYAVAFFKMSRSIFTMASSRLTRASSISTSVSGLCCFPTSLSLPSLFALTQYRMVYEETDNLRPTSGILSPPSVTSFTASSLSSFV